MHKLSTIKTKKAFSYIFKEGHKSVFSSFVLYWVSNSDFTNNNRAFAVIAAKKVFSLAVERNRAKRILREAIRATTTEQNNFSLILVARRKLLTTGLNQIKKDLEDAVQAESKSI